MQVNVFEGRINNWPELPMAKQKDDEENWPHSLEEIARNFDSLFGEKAIAKENPDEYFSSLDFPLSVKGATPFLFQIYRKYTSARLSLDLTKTNLTEVVDSLKWDRENDVEN